MKSQTTTIWFLIALVLAGFIWFSQSWFRTASPVSAHLLSSLRAADVTSIQVSPAGMHEISAVYTNQSWELTTPVAYPAQGTAIKSLLSALEKLSPTLAITAAEMDGHKNADAEFGFDDPQYTVDIAAGDQNWHLRVGNKTAPGDGVYVRVVGANGAFVTEPGWLQFLPHDVSSWRDMALVNTESAIDWIVITNGAKVIELCSDATNHVWRMIRPLQARADGARIAGALQLLRSTSATKFVSDDPKTDLSTFGLQPSASDIWLGQGTNLLTALHAGKDATDDPASMYVQRQGWNSVMTTAKEPLAPWRGAVNDWRDRHLITLNAPIAEIQVSGDHGFTLEEPRGATNWVVAGEKFTTDLENIKQYVRLLAGLRVNDFVKDVVTGADLQDFGLGTNARLITIFGKVDDTNAILSQLIFGGINANHIYVKRGDEDFVYDLTLDDYAQLPAYGWEFRDRRIWGFSETNVSQITLHQGSRTLQMLRLGPNSWSLASGSQGMINPLGVEETVHRLGDLVCDGWADRGVSDPAKFGLGTNNLEITVELKTGEKLAVDFGGVVPQRQTLFAATMVDGERWAFEFPPALLALVAQYLTIPPPPQ